MEPDRIIKSVVEKLEYLRDVPVDEFVTGLDEVQLKIVDLRDRVIGKLRKEPDGADRRHYLQQVNLSLSLIFGLEYPVTGFQRNKIKTAVEVLKPLADAVI